MAREALDSFSDTFLNFLWQWQKALVRASLRMARLFRLLRRSPASNDAAPPPAVPSGAAGEDATPNDAAPPPPEALLCSVHDQLATIASYLEPADALALDASAKDTRCVALEPLRTITSDAKSWQGAYNEYAAYPWLDLPAFGRRPHTARLEFLWRDQGWGNQKGMLSVVRNGGAAPGDYQPWSADVVCGRDPAPHHLTRASMSFAPRPGEAYKLWVRVGGGGGHALTVVSVRARVLAYS